VTHHVKTCTKCGQTLSATPENFYRHPKSKFGLTARCKPCVNADNAENLAKNLAEDPERVRKLATERSKRHYHKNIEKSRAKHRAAAKRRLADPEQRAVIYFRKRAGYAGLTPEQWNAMFDSQGRVCAICKADDPGAKAGWNTDHCHKTKKVRFILCAHCNRGLGAFKDSPALLRAAADALERIQNQPARPVSAIMERG
jgi:hypothetical protein